MIKKILLAIFILLVLFVVFGLHPTAIHFGQKSLSKSLKSDVKITKLVLYPLEIDAMIYPKNYPEGIEANAKYIGGPSLKPKSIGKILITSESLGGLVNIIFEKNIYDVTVKDVDFKKLAKLLNDKKKVVQAGIVNGKILYHKKTREGKTDLKATEVVLDVDDIDQTITSINDALNLNFLTLLINNVDKNQKKKFDLTDVSHFQFDIFYKQERFISHDVALKTDKYRIALNGDIHKQGNINLLDMYLLDKNGCALVTQKFSGTLKEYDSDIYTSIVTAKKVVDSTPKSFWSFGRDMMEYGSKYAAEQTGFKKQNEQMTSYVLKESDKYFNNASKIVMPSNCQVIYDGKVKHPNGKNASKKREKKKTTAPAKKKKVEETEPTHYRKEILL
jgi:hypothetical protein